MYKETKPTYVDLHFKKSPAPRGGNRHKACSLFSRVRRTWHYITQIRAQAEARLLEEKKGTECRVKVWISRALKFVWLIQRRGAGGKSFSEKPQSKCHFPAAQPASENGVSCVVMWNLPSPLCCICVWWLSCVLLLLWRWWRQAEGGVAWWNCARCGSLNDWLRRRIRRCARWED